jgi:CheY-like chemotaxis protein
VNKILLIDDSPIQAEARKRVLETAGFSVQVAMDARSALDTLRSPEVIDGIVTDHVMPEVSGAEFVRMLRAIDPDVPVLVISGMIGAEEEYEGLSVTFKLKPCPPPELIATMQSLLE